MSRLGMRMCWSCRSYDESAFERRLAVLRLSVLAEVGAHAWREINTNKNERVDIVFFLAIGCER